MKIKLKFLRSITNEKWCNMHLNEDKKLNNDSSTRRKMNFLECVDHKRIIYDQQTIITVLYSSILKHHNTHYRFKPLWVELNVLYTIHLVIWNISFNFEALWKCSLKISRRRSSSTNHLTTPKWPIVMTWRKFWIVLST